MYFGKPNGTKLKQTKDVIKFVHLLVHFGGKNMETAFPLIKKVTTLLVFRRKPVDIII